MSALLIVLTLIGAAVLGTIANIATQWFAYPVLARRWPEVYGPPACQWHGHDDHLIELDDGGVALCQRCGTEVTASKRVA